MTGQNRELEEYKEQARIIFSRTKYCQTEREEDQERLEYEVEKLAQNMQALDDCGLHKLNISVIKSGRKVWDFIAEHNFAYELLKANPGLRIDYEPDEYSKL